VSRIAPGRAAALAIIQAYPGLRRADIAVRLHKSPNATSRLLYMLHQMGAIEPSGVGKLTTWTAVESATLRQMPVTQARPIAPMRNLFPGARSIFEVAA
jgi:DNA-binding IclR family transcriptional regulator